MLKYFDHQGVNQRNMFHFIQHETTFNKINLFSSFLLTQYLLSAVNKERRGGVIHSTQNNQEQVVQPFEKEVYYRDRYKNALK